MGRWRPVKGGGTGIRTITELFCLLHTIYITFLLSSLFLNLFAHYCPLLLLSAITELFCPLTVAFVIIISYQYLLWNLPRLFYKISAFGRIIHTYQGKVRVYDFLQVSNLAGSVQSFRHSWIWEYPLTFEYPEYPEYLGYPPEVVTYSGLTAGVARQAEM